MHQLFLQDSRVRAVGEIGLDFYWDDCPPDIQHKAFRDQLHLARQLEKPVVIHSRNATEATLEVLEGEGFQDYPLLWHCFGGNRDEALRIVNNGWHISIPGPVSYPANEALREAVAAVPPDKLWLATDFPYLAPRAFGGPAHAPPYAAFRPH